ncbi:MAG: DUF3999 domain-containing protein [Burkholderiales bacterium]
MMRTARSIAVGIAAVLAVNMAVAAESPNDFAMAMPLTTAGAHAHFEFAIPAAVYEGVVHADLADVRVFNGKGEAVPTALRPRAPLQTAPSSLIALTPFALRGSQASGVDAAMVRIQRRGEQLTLEMHGSNALPAETLLGYLVDTSNIKQSIRSLRFDLDGTSEISTAARVEASDDLKSWRTVTDNAPILRLEAGGQRLVQDRVEFPARAAKYWRVVFVTSRPAVPLKAVIAELIEGPVEPDRQQREFAGAPTSDRPGDFLFDTKGQFPAERVRVIAPQINSVAMVEVLSRAKSSDPWISRTRGTVFRLSKEGVESASAPSPVAVTSDRYWLVRVDQRGGGLGPGAPGLALEWQPHRLVFVARGESPFQLSFGSATAKSAMLPLEAVLPAAVVTQPGAAESAPPTAVAIAIAESASVRAIAGDAARTPPFPYRTWALWASILAAVAMLAWMAWRLTRQLKTSAPPASDP